MLDACLSSLDDTQIQVHVTMEKLPKAKQHLVMLERLGLGYLS